MASLHNWVGILQSKMLRLGLQRRLVHALLLAAGLVTIVLVLSTYHRLSTLTRPIQQQETSIPYKNNNKHDNHIEGSSTVTHQSPLPPLPTDYTPGITESVWCQEHFGLKYLENARDWHGQYCKPDSISNLSCFWSKTADNGRIDAMCYSTNAIFDPDAKVFRIGCPLRSLDDETDGKSLPKVPGDLHQYWYQTGPAMIIGNTLIFNDTVDATVVPTRTTILLKREGSGNLWHTLMEMMSVSWTMDVLFMTPDPQGKTFTSAGQRENTQIVIIDDHEDGPYIELWSIFADMSIRRLKELDANEPTSNIVVPFAGGSNPIWQGDWVDLQCKDAPLIRTFVRRVYTQLKIQAKKPQEKIQVNFVDRSGSRRLIDQEAHIEALKRGIPRATINVVDFASMTLQEQIQTARNSDVLVGVHGAGLTHTMFMESGSAVVELVPKDFKHKGFRNLAQMVDLTYYRTHATTAPGVAGSGNWQGDPVAIEQEQFVRIVSAAVHSMYSNGNRSHDIE